MHVRLAIAVVLVAGALGTWLTSLTDPGPEPGPALARLLAREGLEVEPSDVHPLDPPREGLWFGRWLVLGQRRGDPQKDVFMVLARTTPSGRVLGVATLTNVTRSFGASEESLRTDGTVAAFAITTAAGTVAIELMDFRGEEASLTRGWSPAWKVANAITSLQRYGQPQGVKLRRYELAAPLAAGVELAFASGRVQTVLGGRPLVIDPRRDEPLDGADLVTVRPSAKGRPGLIGWAVDTARAVSWIGPHGIEWMEHKAFRVRDVISRGVHRVAPEASSAEIARDMGMGDAPVAPSGGVHLPEEASESALGWPPEPLQPMDLPKRYESEGRWASLDADEFVPGTPGAPPLFVTTWLRADRERQYARVYLVAWDPRQVELKIRSGAAEPMDETGGTGTGEIPRDPATMRRLVGAFNGGFQAIHGEYGLMEDGHAFLPPKPWAATVAEMADGSIGFGTWPESLTEIPAEVVAYRQNMTPLVADGRFNPYGRSWWGAAPPQAPDQVHTVRTGICMMQDGFVAYLWGNDLSHEALGNAMQLARCEYGIHLDMNMGLCGFELYRVFEAGTVRALGRAPQADFEAQGEIEGAPDLRFRARRLVRSMNSMNFPRYVGREQRDFFYLLARPILPGPALAPPIAPALEREGEWSVKGLPHNGFPWAFARTFVRPLPARPDARVLLVRVDPDRVRTRVPHPTRRGEPSAGGVLLGSIVVGPASRIAASNDAFTLAGPRLSEVAQATAAAGTDAQGILVYAQGPDREALAAALALADVAAPIALGQDARMSFHFPPTGGGRHPGQGRVARLDEGGPLADPPDAVRFYAATDTPTAERLFAEVPFAPPRVWQAKQGERVRYFKGRVRHRP